MNDSGVSRVAVYIDFDNIVISRYDQIHGRNQFQRDRTRVGDREGGSRDPEVLQRLKAAEVDIGAVIDYASSFGTLVLTRAYADWSLPVNADYRAQLVARAVDLVQLFPAAAYGKNGADIRLAVDAVEDMFRLPDLTHVVIVGGDSDYIALAQRCRRLGRYVVGVGVAGSTARSLTAACDEFVSYDALPGVGRAEPTPVRHDDTDPEPVAVSGTGADDQEVATRLLERALRLAHETDDSEWLHSSAVKSQMKRMDSSFSEKALGYRTFTDFIRSREQVADLDDSTQANRVRLRSGTGQDDEPGTAGGGTRSVGPAADAAATTVRALTTNVPSTSDAPAKAAGAKAATEKAATGKAATGKATTGKAATEKATTEKATPAKATPAKATKERATGRRRGARKASERAAEAPPTSPSDDSPEPGPAPAVEPPPPATATTARRTTGRRSAQRAAGPPVTTEVFAAPAAAEPAAATVGEAPSAARKRAPRKASATAATFSG